MTTTPAAAAQEAFELTADGKYIVHADHWSRENFSQMANPEVFTNTFTRELYNAIRQTLVDGKPGDLPAYTMVPQNNLSEVRWMLYYMGGGDMNSALRYDRFVPQNISNYYEHANYFAVSVEMPETHKAALSYIQPVVEYVNTLTSDREKVIYLNDYLCSQMAYDYEKLHHSSPVEVFTSHTGEATGVCADYSANFQFLCQAANIPCICIESKEKNHEWNMVYADGQWLHVDAAFNDAVSPVLLVKDRPDYPDSKPEATAFIKELLVPGSTAN